MKEATRDAVRELGKGIDTSLNTTGEVADKTKPEELRDQKFPNLQGIKVYTVHFCEYRNGLLVQDTPVFTASSPEWAMGYCKSHTEMAPKGIGTVDWWYFYITEEAINDSQEGQGWIAIMDWDGNLRNDTYRIDKGYDHKYVKDHVIYEQDTEGDCESCAEAEKDEEDKTNERTQAAVKDATDFVKGFFVTPKVGTSNEGDWVKIFAMGVDYRITDSDYKTLHEKFGVVAGNRILFYTAKSTTPS